MKKVINSYEDRLRNPFLELIDFSVFMSDPYLAKMKVQEAYMLNDGFRMQVREKLISDIIFRKKFEKYLPELYKKIQDQKAKSQGRSR